MGVPKSWSGCYVPVKIVASTLNFPSTRSLVKCHFDLSRLFFSFYGASALFQIMVSPVFLLQPPLLLLLPPSSVSVTGLGLPSKLRPPIPDLLFHRHGCKYISILLLAKCICICRKCDNYLCFNYLIKCFRSVNLLAAELQTRCPSY